MAVFQKNFVKWASLALTIREREREKKTSSSLVIVLDTECRYIGQIMGILKHVPIKMKNKMKSVLLSI